MKALLLAATLAFGTTAHSLEFKPGAELLLTGQVSKILPDQMFFMQVDDQRVLVYANARQLHGVRSGVRVSVRGTVPRDWVKLASNELHAISVQAALPER